MMPHEPVLDVMRRTMANLEFIETHASSAGPFEITQLINSFLGAMAHPWEQLKTDLDSIPIEEAISEGWPKLRKERSSDREPSTLGELVRLLRNGIAHGNIDFHPDGQGRIAALRFVNKNKQDRRTWGVIVTPADMRQFLRQFVALVEAIAKDVSSSSGKAA